MSTNEERLTAIEQERARSQVQKRYGLSDADVDHMNGTPAEILEAGKKFSEHVPPTRPAPGSKQGAGDGAAWLERYKAADKAGRDQMDLDVSLGKTRPLS